eukprot:2563949-Pyramimonas_sp.AAC.1
MDGSCRRHTVGELSQAGWAAVMASQAGERLGIFKGPLWAPWPQTPKARNWGPWPGRGFIQKALLAATQTAAMR